MKFKTILSVAAIAVALPLAGCRIQQTEEGELPDIDVEVSGGQLPKYDVDAPQVDFDTETAEVSVPDVDVDIDMKEKEITVPDVDVTLPGQPGYRDDDPKNPPTR